MSEEKEKQKVVLSSEGKKVKEKQKVKERPFLDIDLPKEAVIMVKLILLGFVLALLISFLRLAVEIVFFVISIASIYTCYKVCQFQDRFKQLEKIEKMIEINIDKLCKLEQCLVLFGKDKDGEGEGT